jgi:hypothetical protein
MSDLGDLAECMEGNYSTSIGLADKLLTMAIKEYDAHPESGATMFSLFTHAGGILAREAAGDIDNAVSNLLQNEDTEESFKPVLERIRAKHRETELTEELKARCVEEYMVMTIMLFPYVLGNMGEKAYYTLGPDVTGILIFFSVLNFSIASCAIGEEATVRIIDGLLDKLIEEGKFPVEMRGKIFNAEYVPPEYLDNAVFRGSGIDSYKPSDN